MKDLASLRTVAGLSTAAVVVGLLGVSACVDAPTAPESEASLNTFGRDGDGVAMPIEVDATFMWIVDQEDVPASCAGTPGLAEGFGSGEANHLGRFEITELDHCSIDVAAFQADLGGLEPGDPGFEETFRAALLDHVLRSGTFAWSAADGSTLSGTCVIFLFEASPGSGEFGEGAFMSMSIDDGTGRFSGASGELVADLERSVFPTSDDPLFLEKATFPVVLEGSLTLPRPGPRN